MKNTRTLLEEALNNVAISEGLRIIEPRNETTFSPNKGEQTRLITVIGTLDKGEVGKGRKILVVIKTDRDYPQALGLAEEKWQFPGCRLGGVDHEIFAVLLDFEDNPIFKSKSVKVRLQRE